MRGVPPQLAVGGRLNGFASPTTIDSSAGQYFCEWNLSRPHSHDLLTQSAKGMNCIPLYLLGHCCYIAFVALCNRFSLFLAEEGSPSLGLSQVKCADKFLESILVHASAVRVSGFYTSGHGNRLLNLLGTDPDPPIRADCSI